MLFTFITIRDHVTDMWQDRWDYGDTGDFYRELQPVVSYTRSSATAKSTARTSCLGGVLYFSGEYLLMANQPLLRSWPRKLPNSAK